MKVQQFTSINVVYIYIFLKKSVCILNTYIIIYLVSKPKKTYIILNYIILKLYIVV